MERFSFLPNVKSEYFICMICLTNTKERYENFKLQKKNIPNLALYDAITPDIKGFSEECSKINFHKSIDERKGSKALWLSQINVFNYFLKTGCKYLVVLEDDAVVPANLEDLLNKNYINHEEFLELGGTRLGQYASCNLYNKFCVKNILDTTNKYPIDRNLDHYASNINSSGKKERVPYNVHGSLSNLPKTITNVNPNISKKSMLGHYNKIK